MRRKPASSTTRYAGTISEKKGSCRPTIAERSCVVLATSRPSIGARRPPRVVIGMPIEPKATGAVLATRASTAAGTASKPRPASIAALIATGAPNPAMPSTSAPKQNATRSAWTRRSSVSRASERRMTSKSPLATVRL